MTTKIMGLLKDMMDKIGNLRTPKVGHGAEICLGIVNCFFWGIGTMVAGFMSNDLGDVLIGLLQLLIPFVGWIWSIVWGILMIFGKNSG